MPSRSLRRPVERGIVEDDVRALPPSRGVSFFPVPRELALNRLADVGGAGEGDLVDALDFTSAAPVRPSP